MKILKWMAVSMAGVLLAMGLCACGGEPEVSLEPDYSAMIEAQLDLTLENLLSEEEVSQVLGTDMIRLGVFEDGTQLMFGQDTGAYQVMVQMINTTRGQFDEDMNQMAELSAIEDTGEVAWWDAATRQAMAYADGYAVSVCVEVGDADMEVQPMAVSLLQRVLENMEN